MFLKGHTNEGTYKKLKQLIITAATLGGICIGLLTIFADFLGAIGSGTGILLTVNIIYSLYEEVVKNKAKKNRKWVNWSLDYVISYIYFFLFINCSLSFNVGLAIVKTSLAISFNNL